MSDVDDDMPADDGGGAPPPRETTVFFGHAGAEQALLEAYRGGHLPHAWLIGGPPGIGKATLAYRMARFVLAHPDPSAPAVAAATSLAVSANNPVTRRVAGEAHSDLLVLERRLNDKGKLRQDIAVDDVRRTISFFGSTAGEGGWRVAIADTVEDLNKAGENALLKVLEEPPARALLLLVSQTPGRVLPTIRSRCRRLLLRPLAETEVKQAAAAALGRQPDDAEIASVAAFADGSVARALSMLDGDALELRRNVTALLRALPKLDARALHALGDNLATAEQSRFAAFVDIVNDWLAARLQDRAADKAGAIRIAEAWEKVNRATRDAEIYNLDRKPLIFSTFGLLAEVSAG